MKIDKMIDDISLAQDKKYQALSAFHDGRPYELERYVKEFNETNDDIKCKVIQQGKKLITIYAMEGKDAVLQLIESGKLETSWITAWRWMAIAKKFTGFDEKFLIEMRPTKLYNLLAAPDEEIENLKDNQVFFDISQDDLLKMSKRQLEGFIKEKTEKLRNDVLDKDARVKTLTEVNQQQKHEIEQLKRAKELAETGAPPEEKLPSWWTHYTTALNTISALAGAIAADKPDVKNHDMDKKCRFVADRLEKEIAEATLHLRNWVVDPRQHKQAVEARISKVTNEEGEFDADKL